MFENFKTNILITLLAQITTTKIKKTQLEAYTPLAVFCPTCRKKHPYGECELNNISLCKICELEHSIEKCLELPRLKETLRESSEEV